MPGLLKVASVTSGGVFSLDAINLIDTNFSGANNAVVNTALATVGNGTLLAAAINGGVITRTGPTVAFTDTTDTALAILFARANIAVGQGWLVYIVNQTAFAQTIAGGSGVTISGGAIIAANTVATLQVSYTGAGAVTITLLSTVYSQGGLGFDPNTTTTQFGAGLASFLEEGNVSRQISAAGVSPGAIAVDSVLAVYLMPANSFDVLGRGLTITVAGAFGATANTKRIKIIFNPATAVVGATVGAGGSLVADTGVVATNGGGWWISGNVFKYGAANSNTQICTNNGSIAGITHNGTTAPVLAAAVENAPILIAITGNATTVVTDILFNWLEVNAMN